MAKTTTKQQNGKKPVPKGLGVFSFVQQPVIYEVLPDLRVELSQLPIIKGVDDIEYITVILERFSPVSFYDFAPELKEASPGEQVYLVCEWAVADWAGTGEPPNPELLKQDPSVEWAAACVYEFVNTFFQSARFLPKPGNSQNALSGDGGDDG